MISETLRRQRAILTRAIRPVSLALSSAILCLVCLGAGCPSRPEIEAYVWLNNGLPPELCAKHPELRDYGFYRRLNDGKVEFIAFCDPLSVHWLAVYDRDYQRLLDKYLPARSGD